MMRRTKPRNYECPWCGNIGMFTQRQSSGRLILLGCEACQQGEMFPKHPSWRVIDFYHMCIDNKNKGSVPVFKFDKLTSEQFEFLREHVTLGKIECYDVIEEVSEK